MGEVTLRDYQTRNINDIRSAFVSGHRRVCSTMPTGSGKTVEFAWLATVSAMNGRRVLILVHRGELVQQIRDKLSDNGCNHGVIMAGERPDFSQQVQVATVQTLINRLHLYGPFDTIIVDECHHAIAAQYVRITEYYSEALIIGFTATPCRLDGRGLFPMFHHLVIGPSTRELISSGYLVQPVVYAPSKLDISGVRTIAGDFNRRQLTEAIDKPTIYGDVLRHWHSLSEGLSTVAFCVSVAHAEHTAREFELSGVPAVSIDGRLDAAERKARIQALKSGEIKVLTSCDLISEGFDMPAIHTAVLLRPTKSLSLNLQQVGRALRPCEGKSRAIILDHAGNCYRHGLPDDERKWELTADKIKDKPRPLSSCPECYAMFYPQRECPVCGGLVRGFSFGKPKTKPRLKPEAELVMFRGEGWKAEDLRNMPLARAIRKAETPEDLRAIARAKGYKAGWISQQLKMRPRFTAVKHDTN